MRRKYLHQVQFLVSQHRSAIAVPPNSGQTPLLQPLASRTLMETADRDDSSIGRVQVAQYVFVADFAESYETDLKHIDFCLLDEARCPSCSGGVRSSSHGLVYRV